MKSSNLTISAIQCPYCNDIIFSRARHDFRSCTCEKTAIDGGRSYLKLGFASDNIPEVIRIELIGITEKDLVDDWNYRKDKFGLIPTEHKTNSKFYKYYFSQNREFVGIPINPNENTPTFLCSLDVLDIQNLRTKKES